MLNSVFLFSPPYFAEQCMSLHWFWVNRINTHTQQLLSRKWINDALFLSLLDYSDVVYRFASASTLAASFVLALRFTTGDSYYTHHCILYEKVGSVLLSARCNRHFFLLLFIYEVLISIIHPHIVSILNQSDNHYWACCSYWRIDGSQERNTSFGKTAFGFSNAFT